MLGGKKRTVVDLTSFINLQRSYEEGQEGELFGTTSVNAKALGGFYLPYPEKDTVRLALGKYWDYEADIDDAGQIVAKQTKIFHHQQNPINIFCGTNITMEECDPGVYTYIQETPYGESKFGGFRQKIILECEVPTENINNYITEGASTETPVYDLSHGTFWTYLMKYGVNAPDKELKPIIKSTNINPENPQVYYDHYHVSPVPYTPKELLSQQTYGKVLYADYKSYYNTRANTIRYEDFIAAPRYQNSLPNIYGMVKLANKQGVTKETYFNFMEEYRDILYWYEPPAGRMRNDTYTGLFQERPVEASFFLYGALMVDDTARLSNSAPEQVTVEESDKTLETLLTLNTKTVDADGAVKEYLDDYRRHALWTGGKLHSKPPSNFGGKFYPDSRCKFGALEHINSNLLFGSNVSSMLQKANQYKDYWPMYIDLSFTSQDTQLSDTIKKSKLIKYLGYEIAASQRIPGWYPTAGPGHPNFFYQDNSSTLDFVDYIDKEVYENTEDDGFINIPALTEPGQEAYLVNTKKTIPLVSNRSDNPGMLDKWMSSDDYSSQNDHPMFYPEESISSWSPSAGGSWTTQMYQDFIFDVRNYVAFINSEEAEEANNFNSDCNPLIKILFGPAFLEDLKSIYNEKARTYSDILNGVPAYAEDLFYVIKKFRTDFPSGGGAAAEKHVQNIIIPNTSDLNIVQYIDTQVKYGNHAAYRYEVYANRVVFGSKYYYTFMHADAAELNVAPIESGGSMDVLIYPLELAVPVSPLPAEAQYNVDYPPNPLVNEALPSSFKYAVTPWVTIEPSISLVEAQIFSTTKIKILDAPPVPPYVNIVPYRAVSNRVKILLGGSTDTFRAEPVPMLPTDGPVFEDIYAAQFSNDGKIRFSSDDKVANFQVFRTDKRPTMYSEFELHPDVPEIATGGFAAFDDAIEPNKKYYYTFRTVDVHGHMSNPTPVYEVELIDEKGAVQPIIKTISMELEKNKIPIKEIQKYLFLKVTDNQIYFPDKESVNSVFSTYGEQDNKKKYKMRITSKGTGKKIDINFSFTKKET